MSHLSLAFASKTHDLAASSVVMADRGFERGQATTLPNLPSIRDGEASRFEDCTLPAGIASMEHWLDLNA